MSELGEHSRNNGTYVGEENQLNVKAEILRLLSLKEGIYEY
jgi:hypothetical protein